MLAIRIKAIWEYIKDSDLYFWFLRKKRVKYVIEGSCKMCGECCKKLILGYNGRPMTSHRQFKKLLRGNPGYSIFKPYDKVSDDGYLRCSCTKLGEDNRCTAHEIRPALCRRYPDPAILKFGGGLLPGCGYRIVPKQSFEDLLNDELNQ